MNNIVRYKADGKTGWGVAHGERIFPLDSSAATLADFLREDAAGARALDPDQLNYSLKLSDVELLSPVTEPCRVVCQGLNYKDHVIEAGGDPRDIQFNMIFRKSSTSIAPPDTEIRRPEHVRLLDYEVELGIVIGREIDANSKITNENLGEYIAGIVVANDVSARDVQIPQGQWYKGKSYPTFCPLGPFLRLLEPGEAHLLSDLDLELRVNGEVRQRSNTGNLIFPPAPTLAEIATFMKLSPGDILLTGTPGGVVVKAPPAIVRRLAGLFLNERQLMEVFVKKQAQNPAYLKTGDVIESRIYSDRAGIDLGLQRNVVV